MEENAKQMSLLMGFSMSLVLTFIGMAGAGKLSMPGFLFSFIVSFLISLLVAKIIPAKKISAEWTRKLQLTPGSFKARLLDALVTDLSYSPLMTLVMILIAYCQSAFHGAAFPFVPVLLKSELISFSIAFVLGFALPPFYMKLLMKKKDKE